MKEGTLKYGMENNILSSCLFLYFVCISNFFSFFVIFFLIRNKHFIDKNEMRGNPKQLKVITKKAMDKTMSKRELKDEKDS